MASQQIMFPGPPPPPPIPPRFTFPTQGSPSPSKLTFYIEVYSVDETTGAKTLLKNFQGKLKDVSKELNQFVVYSPQGQTIAIAKNPNAEEPFRSMFIRDEIMAFLNSDKTNLELKNPASDKTLLLLEKNTYAGAPAAAVPINSRFAQAAWAAQASRTSQTTNGGFKKVGGKKRKTCKQTQRRRKTRRILKSKH